MAVNWTPLVDLIHRHQRFLLSTHIRPDPDGLGSQLALAEVLEQMGKQVQMVISSNWPPRYNFMDPDKRIERFQPPGEKWYSAQVIIVLDTGTWGQLGDFAAFVRESQAEKVVIDHHLSQDDLGGLQMLDTTVEATGRLVYDLIQALGVPLTPSIANLLLAALATDTGWFRHSNTTSATMELAGKLIEAGANPTWLYEQIYEQNTLGRLKLTGLTLGRLEVLEDGLVACTWVQNDDYQATGAIPQDTEDLINYTRSLAGVEVGLFFMEQPAGGVKVSFRARSRVNVAKIAEQFGGGGHRLAAGAILNTSLEEARSRVLEAVRTALRG